MFLNLPRPGRGLEIPLEPVVHGETRPSKVREAVVCGVIGVSSCEQSVQVQSHYLKKLISKIGEGKVIPSEPELNEEIDRLLHLLYPELGSEEIAARLKLVDPAVVIKRIKDKDILRRWASSLLVLSELLSQGPALVTGETYNDRARIFDRCFHHVRLLWESAAHLCRAGHYAQAVALSITCIEETGKLAVERFRLWGADAIDVQELEYLEAQSLKRPSFYDHRTKHLIAAGAGALINNRIDRILGLEWVTQFLNDAETKELEMLRRRCLYMDVDQAGTLQIPREQISDEMASKYVSLAGELAAEIAGFEPSVWKKMLDEVQAFEFECGLTTPKIESAAAHALDQEPPPSNPDDS